MSLRSAASMPVPYRSGLFIDNEWHATEKTFAVGNPATEKELFQCARATAPDVDAAVRSAQRCFRSEWSRIANSKKRAAAMRKMATQLREQLEDFAVLETLDNGKPINEARADIAFCADIFDYYAGFADNLEAKHSRREKTSDTDFRVRLVDEPIGVVGMVTPWNYPLLQSVIKVAPAIAAGCTMVLKPSSVCPATSLRIGDLAVGAGLPPGAINIITGTGREAGSALLDHPRTDHLSFTGSSGVGHTVLHAAAKRLVPSAVELGGKGAIVLFDDVDIEAAVDWTMIGIFMCSGQSCSATSRLIVHERIADRFLERLVAEVDKIRVGDPLSEDTQMGPVTSAEQLEIISGFVERARAEGAEVLCGGHALPGKGSFYRPTILANLRDDSEAWQEEIFGPVLAVRTFKTEEEAVHAANDTPYGLGNAVLTQDAERCERVAQQLHAGVVWKNCSNALPVEAPFGGFGKSGFGKEYGAMGFEEYFKTKVITSCDHAFSWEWYVARSKK
eukprot:NODE_5341_length_1781_cov_5.980048.p1 GENE.NODE_5341_length_1781_cov_5.980048~~NODE_5341_length_1781_cov_5.980048.p1  ORF type:complete len:504 (-),score=194.92 NODE_5341_length_1781_cov_5.980048:136-1647(-)